MDIQLQANALSALCRLLFGFRLSMTALATPFALTATRDRPAAWLTGAAVLVTVMVSYTLLRDWSRFGPVLLRHPALLGLDMLFGALLLFAASPDSTLAYAAICTPLLAGLVYGPRGAAFYAVLQILLVAAAYAAHSTDRATAAPDSSPLLISGLCAIAAAAGTSLRRLLLRLTTASQALTDAHARLAVADERARMAREMHDSVAKTLHGLALAADALAHSAHTSDHPRIRREADLVAESARQAAEESRTLLDDLRTPTNPADLPTALRAAATEFTARTGLEVRVEVSAADEMPAWPGKTQPGRHLRPPAGGRYRADRRNGARPGTWGRGGWGKNPGRRPTPPAGDPTADLLAIANEAWENTHRHADATAIDVHLTRTPTHLHLTIRDNGRGLPPGTTLDALRRSGHYGLLGVAERAEDLDAALEIRTPGTEIHLTVPTPRPEGPPCPA